MDTYRCGIPTQKCASGYCLGSYSHQVPKLVKQCNELVIIMLTVWHSF